MVDADILIVKRPNPTDWFHGVGQPFPRTGFLNTYLIADSTFTMRADDKKVANLSPGRESVRLVSNDLFGDGVYIFDVDHVPLGCGTVRFLSILLLQRA